MWRVTKQGSKWYAVKFQEDMDGLPPEKELENIQELLAVGDVVILANDLQDIKEALDNDGDKHEFEVVESEG